MVTAYFLWVDWSSNYCKIFTLNRSLSRKPVNKRIKRRNNLCATHLMYWYQPQKQQQKQKIIVCTICSPCCFSFNRFVALWICRLVGLLKRFVTIYQEVSLFFSLRRRAHSFHFGILPWCAHVINPWNWTRQMCVWRI